MGLKKKLFTVLLLSLFLLAGTPVMANSETVSDISSELICQCGCIMVLSNCDHVECVSRETMTTSIEQKIAAGQSKEQIIQSLVAQYGEQVLASPPKQGFNLVAWILPFVAILGGGGVIYAMLKTWVKRGKILQTDITTETAEVDEEYQRQLEKELEEFTEGGFR